MQTFSDSETRQVKIFILIIIGVYALFIFWMPLLPFIDLPNHLAEATIYKFYNTEGNTISQYYEPTPWFYPNTFHTVFCSLFPSVEFGNKVFYILYIALLLFSVYLTIKQLKGNLWYGLFCVLFIFNYNVTFGFVGFAISIPTILVLLYFTLRDLEEDKLHLKVIISFLLILLFLMHAQNALFGILIYGGLMLYKYYNSFVKLLVRVALVPLPLIVLIFTWWFSRASETKEGSTVDYLLQYYTTKYFGNLVHRYRLVIMDNFRLQEGLAGILIALFFIVCVVVPLLYFKPFKLWSGSFWRNENVRRSAIFLVISSACFFLLPEELPGQYPLFQRFCTLVMISFIIIGSIALSAVASKYLRSFVIGICIIYTALWFEYIYAFNQQNKNFNSEFFADTENTARLAGLMYNNNFRGSRVYLHFPNYFLVWNRGITATKIIDYRFGVVKRRVDESVIPFYYEFIGEPSDPRPTPQYSHLEYILVRGEGPIEKDIDITRFNLLRKAEPWKLYYQEQKKPGLNP
jgi:hypothetical protein